MEDNGGNKKETICEDTLYASEQADLSIYAASAERKREHGKEKNMKKGLDSDVLME